jgi:hypothetical protein
MCVSIKFCHLFVLQTSGRGEKEKKKKITVHFSLKKRGGGSQRLILSDLKSAKVSFTNDQEMPDPRVLTVVMNSKRFKNGN